MRTEEEINQLYEENEVLVYSTVQKRFDSEAFRKAHMLSRDEIIQFGRMGLFQACKTYDKTKGSVFQTYAINNIIWSIKNESRRYSLCSINDSSLELIDRISMEDSLSGQISGETLHDIIESRENGFTELEDKLFIESVRENISERLANTLELRMKGLTFEEIADSLGISKQAVESHLRRNRKKVVNMYLNN